MTPIMKKFNDSKCEEMYKKFVFLLFLGIISLFPVSSHAIPKFTSSFMIDVDAGKIISSANANEKMYPASLTKVMTLYITFTAIENGTLHFDDMLNVSRTAAGRSPTKLGVTAGSKISVKDAVMALIVLSANDCATVLAENIGYSEENFAKAMTSVAHELGMHDTTFKNASGLPNRAQQTTAKDMAVLAAAMYRHFPQYYHLFSAQEFRYNGKTYTGHNEILKTFAGADGMKTGYTNAAGFNIITSAEREGKRVIAVTMGHKTAKERDAKVAAMMDSGLNKIIAGNYVSSSENEEIIVADNEDKNFSIQLGAFSNYAKARKYALEINKKFTKVSKNNIEVEAVKSQHAIVYRSKIMGFAQTEAQKTCNDLKKANKSCIVVSEAKQNIILAQK